VNQDSCFLFINTFLALHTHVRIEFLDCLGRNLTRVWVLKRSMSLWLHTACETSSCIQVLDQTESGSVTFMSSTGCRSSGSTALLWIYRLTNVLNKKNTCQRLCMSVLWWLMCLKYGITAKPANDFQCCLLQPCGGSDWSILNLRKPWLHTSLSLIHSLLSTSVHHLFCYLLFPTLLSFTTL